jgi:hypothetical protein
LEKDKGGMWDSHKPNDKWAKLSDGEILKNYADDGSSYEDGYTHHSDGTFWSCSMLCKGENDGSYVACIHQHKWRDQQKWDKNNLPKLMTNYP